jgi:hypothetical protein
VLAGAICSADAPGVECLTAGQVAELLHDLAHDRDMELSITVPHRDAPIADLAARDRRALAEALKPRDTIGPV